MKRTIKIAAIVIIIVFAVIQFYRPKMTNPPVVQAETLEAATEVPENARQILVRSCNDCHSNQTVYPWYSNIAPFSWLLADHINEGRRELNFSIWATYGTQRKRNKLDEICEQITGDLMPHSQYLWLHRNAALSEEDKKILCDWTENEKAKLPDA